MNTHAALAEYLRLDRAVSDLAPRIDRLYARRLALREASANLLSLTSTCEDAAMTAEDRAAAATTAPALDYFIAADKALHPQIVALETEVKEAQEARDAWGIVHGISAEVAT